MKKVDPDLMLNLGFCFIDPVEKWSIILTAGLRTRTFCFYLGQRFV